jgi:hypothetical protein
MVDLVMRGRLLALVLSLPLAASGVAGVVLHVCHSMGGVVVAGCDCETQAHHGGHAGHGEDATHEATIKLETQPCCTVELSSASQLVATQEASSLRVDEATVVVVGLADNSFHGSRQVCDLGLFRERAPPNVHGPPIFIRNCSFLN